jgi:hypothetical protein
MKHFVPFGLSLICLIGSISAGPSNNLSCKGILRIGRSDDGTDIILPVATNRHGKT